MTTKEERAHQVRQMLANQRLEGLEPDAAHLQILQEYIDGTASLDDLWRHARVYAEAFGLQDIVEEVKKLSPDQKLELHRQAVADQKAKEAYSKLSDEQRKILDAIDHSVTDSGLEGFVVDPVKIEEWKAYVRAGMSWEALFAIMTADKNKFIATPTPHQVIDRPGWKHMGNGYYSVGDPEDGQ